MPNNSEDPKIVFCASVLAKAYKHDDPDGFGALYDALGKQFKGNELKEIEKLAKNYIELPLHVLNRKINWLRSHRVEPIDVNAVFGQGNGFVANAKATDAESKEGMQSSIKQPEIDEKPVKKKNKKGKKKKKSVEESQVGNSAIEVETKIDTKVGAENTTTVVSGNIEGSVDNLLVEKRKKKKRKKKMKSSTEEENVQPELKDESPSPPEPINRKSPVECPTFDSGIGSCVASGGEDKSSVLSGGTIESIGEGSEMITPSFSFEWDAKSTYVIDYLDKSGSIISEKIEEDFDSGNCNDPDSTKNSKIVEITFGTPAVLDNNSSMVVKTDSKKAKLKKHNKKNDIPKNQTSSQIVETRHGHSEGNEKPKDIKISFVAPCVMDMNIAGQLPEVLKPFPEFRNSDVKGDFDHSSAVKFLWEEWNRTIQNPDTQWYTCP